MKKLFVLLTLCAVGLASLRGQERQAQDDTAKPAEGFSLKTAETIEFTTDEVTWMQVDVSPDGRTILFDLLGDLYTLRSEEHTSELQSRLHLVCRLLLEKKKKQI